MSVGLPYSYNIPHSPIQGFDNVVWHAIGSCRSSVVESANHYCLDVSADEVARGQVELKYFHQQSCKLHNGGLHHIPEQ